MLVRVIIVVAWTVTEVVTVMVVTVGVMTETLWWDRGGRGHGNS